MTSFYSSLAFIWYVHIKNSKTNGWVIPWYLPENGLKKFFLKKMVLDEWSWGDPWWSWTTWTWYHNWNMVVFGGVFLGGQSNGSIGKALLSWVTSPNLHQLDMGWASSMVIAPVGLEPKQKLLSLMNWLFWRIFDRLPPPPALLASCANCGAKAKRNCRWLQRAKLVQVKHFTNPLLNR